MPNYIVTLILNIDNVNTPREAAREAQRMAADVDSAWFVELEDDYETIPARPTEVLIETPSADD